MRVLDDRINRDEPVGVARGAREGREEARGAGHFGRVALEVQIRRELLRRLVEDVELAVEIADEEAVEPAAGLFAEEIHAGNVDSIVRAGAEHAGLRDRGVVGELDGEGALGEDGERREQSEKDAVGEPGQGHGRETNTRWLGAPLRVDA